MKRKQAEKSSSVRWKRSALVKMRIFRAGKLATCTQYSVVWQVIATSNLCELCLKKSANAAILLSVQEFPILRHVPSRSQTPCLRVQYSHVLYRNSQPKTLFLGIPKIPGFLVQRSGTIPMRPGYKQQS